MFPSPSSHLCPTPPCLGQMEQAGKEKTSGLLTAAACQPCRFSEPAVLSSAALSHLCAQDLLCSGPQHLERCWHRIWSELWRSLSAAAFRAVSSQDEVGGSEFSFAARFGNSTFKSTPGTSPEWYWLLFPFLFIFPFLFLSFSISHKVESHKKSLERLKNT